MDTFIIQPKNKAEKSALYAFLKALKMDFTLSGDAGKSPYNPDFVAKIKKSEQQYKEGKSRKIQLEDLWK